MPVTELAILRIKEPYAVESDTLREIFQSVAERQAEWSGYPLTFYNNVQDPSLFYVVSGWKSSDAHREWIASDTNQQFLHLLEPMLSVEGLAHVDVDFAQIPSNTVALLFRKTSIDDAGPEEAKGPFSGRQPSWQGQGIDVDNPMDIYHFETYDNFDESIKLQARGLNILRRVYS